MFMYTVCMYTMIIQCSWILRKYYVLCYLTVRWELLTQALNKKIKRELILKYDIFKSNIGVPSSEDDTYQLHNDLVN